MPRGRPSAHYTYHNSPWTWARVELLRKEMALGKTSSQIYREHFADVEAISQERVYQRMTYERKKNLHRLGIKTPSRPRPRSDQMFNTKAAVASLDKDVPDTPEAEADTPYVPTRERREMFDPHDHRESRHYKGTFDL